MTDPGDVTIATYHAIADTYAERSRVRAPAVLVFLNRFAELVPGATVLEIGSGPGHDAEILERHGLTVLRTDAAPAFVQRLTDAGHDARRLDVRRDPLGGPHDAVLANAVLLHLTTADFERAVRRIHGATRPDGVLALTLKEGDGQELTTAKVGAARWFTYWREDPLRRTLTDAGWEVESLQHIAGAADDWLQVLARRAEPRR